MTVRTFGTVDDQGDLTILRQQDIEPILEANKVAFNSGPVLGSEFRRVASIPLVVYEQLIKKGVIGTDLRVKDSSPVG